MKKSAQLDLTGQSAILIVGDPGTRKTSLALHFPGVYIFDADDNVVGPARHFSSLNFMYDSGTTVSEDWKDPAIRADYKAGDRLEPQHRYRWMAKCLNEAATSPEVKTIVIDSLTALSDIIYSEVKRQEARKDDQPMRIQDFGKFAYIMRNLISQLKANDKLFVLIAHQTIDKDESDGVFKTFLNVPGQSKTTLAGMFNDVLATYVAQSGAGANIKHEFKIRTLPAGKNDHRGLKTSLGLPQTLAWDHKAICDKLQS